MLKQVVLFCLAAGLCTGVSCRIVPGDGGDGGTTDPTHPTLDETDAVIAIVQPAGSVEVDVTATITDSGGDSVELEGQQSVSVNEVELTEAAGDEYTATIDASDTYTVAVREPTRGVERTTIDAPAEFVITSPADGGAASLGGFTLEWSEPDETFQVVIRLSQVLPGGTEVVDFGPFTDTGQRTFSAADLYDFGGGTDLVIAVTKINTLNRIDGFDSGELSVRVSATSTADPR